MIEIDQYRLCIQLAHEAGKLVAGRRGKLDQAMQFGCGAGRQVGHRDALHQLGGATAQLGGFVVAPALDRRAVEVRRLRVALEQRPASSEPAPTSVEATPSLEILEREHIFRVLSSVKGHRTKAAQLLGLDRKTLYRKLEEAGRPEADSDSGAGAPSNPGLVSGHGNNGPGNGSGNGDDEPL